MANIVQGSIYVLKIKGVAMKCQLDTSIAFTQDMETEDACKSVDGLSNIRWASDKPGQKSYSVTINGKVEDEDEETEGTLRNLRKHFLESNEAIEFEIATVGNSLDFVDTMTGTAQITDLSIEMPINGSATYSGTLTGVDAIIALVTPKVP